MQKALQLNIHMPHPKESKYNALIIKESSAPHSISLILGQG